MLTEDSLATKCIILHSIEVIFDEMAKEDKKTESLSSHRDNKLSLVSIFENLYGQKEVRLGIKDRLIESFSKVENINQGSRLYFDKEIPYNKYLKHRCKNTDDESIIRNSEKLVVSKCFGSFISIKGILGTEKKITKQYYHLSRFKTNMTNEIVKLKEPHRFIETIRPTFVYKEKDLVYRVEDLKKAVISCNLASSNNFVWGILDGSNVESCILKSEIRPLPENIIQEISVNSQDFKIGEYIRIDPKKVESIMTMNGWSIIWPQDHAAHTFWKKTLPSFIAKIIDFKFKSAIVNFYPSPEVERLGIKDFNFSISLYDCFEVLDSAVNIYTHVLSTSKYRHSLDLITLEQKALNISCGTHNNSNNNNDKQTMIPFVPEVDLKKETEEKNKKNLEEDIAAGPYPQLNGWENKIVKLKNWNPSFKDTLCLINKVDVVSGRVYVKYYNGRTAEEANFREAQNFLSHVELIGNQIFSEGDE